MHLDQVQLSEKARKGSWGSNLTSSSESWKGLHIKMQEIIIGTLKPYAWSIIMQYVSKWRVNWVMCFHDWLASDLFCISLQVAIWNSVLFIYLNQWHLRAALWCLHGVRLNTVSYFKSVSGEGFRPDVKLSFWLLLKYTWFEMYNQVFQMFKCSTHLTFPILSNFTHLSSTPGSFQLF